MLDGTAVHLLAGGIGGTVGAVITCPLEVVKTRLQSSQTSNFSVTSHPKHPGPSMGTSPLFSYRKNLGASIGGSSAPSVSPGLALSGSRLIAKQTTGIGAGEQMAGEQIAGEQMTGEQLKMEQKARAARTRLIGMLVHITKTEGFSALYKGLGPTLVGVLPSRAIYFSTYHNSQKMLSGSLEPNSAPMYLCSAAIGSFTASTITNPIWYVKTRLQLDTSTGVSSFKVMRRIIHETWHKAGIKGFYRGVTASYAGISETALNFLIYENVKARLLDWIHEDDEGDPGVGPGGKRTLQSSSDILFCSVASACSKTIATTIAYPHEVARTRLREGNDKYHGFVQTLRAVLREEGTRGLYRGLLTHCFRQIPNYCIIMVTYEYVVFLLQSWGLAEVQN